MTVGGETWLVTAVSMGNPHCITFGREGECDAGGSSWMTSISRAGVPSSNPTRRSRPRPTRSLWRLCAIRVKMHVWERAGATLACGTGACATVVAAVLEGRTDRKCTVELPGGPLEIEWRESDNRIIMTGPAEMVFNGVVAPA